MDRCGAQFEYKGQTVYTLGSRQTGSVKMVLLVSTLTLLLIPAIFIWFAIAFDEMYQLAIGFGIYGGIMLIIFFACLPDIINNRIKYPSVGLREDGVIIIFRSNTKAVFLYDKITYVRHKNHSTVINNNTSYSQRIGNTVYTTTTHRPPTVIVHSWGKVIFSLRSPSGQAYTKVVRRVADCQSVAEKIKAMMQGE